MVKTIKRKKRKQPRWIIFILSIVITVFLVKYGIFNRIIAYMGDYGIIGIFISGIFFGYAFTVAPATASLILFTKTFNPFIISFIGALGTMIGNLILFNFFKKEVPREIKDIAFIFKIRKLKKTKWKWIIPGIAGFIILSPLPDEIGVAILEEEDFKINEFMLFSFILSFMGILIITTIAWLV